MPSRAGSLILVASLCLASDRGEAAPAGLLERVSAVAEQAGMAPPQGDPGAAPEVPPLKRAGPSRPAPVFLSGGNFEGLAPFDTGFLSGRCTNLAPWGSGGWGLNAASFARADEARSLEGVRLRVFDDGGNRVAGIFAKESRGLTMGFARFVQGDAWGGTSCPGAGRIGWGKPEPLPVSGRRLALKIDVKNERARKYSNRFLRGGVGGTSHVMMAFNVWLASPRLPKRAVLDLAVLHDCNWGVGPCGPNTHEGDSAYHYIIHLAPDGSDSPKGRWSRWLVDLSRHIGLAADRFGWSREARETLAITQVEFLVEVMDGEGGVLFDNIHLLEVPEGLKFGDASLSLPAARGADPLPVR